MSKLPKRKQAWAKLREHNRNYPAARCLGRSSAGGGPNSTRPSMGHQISASNAKKIRPDRARIGRAAPGTGKKIRNRRVCTSDKARRRRNAGADIVGMEDLAESVKAGSSIWTW